MSCKYTAMQSEDRLSLFMSSCFSSVTQFLKRLESSTPSGKWNTAEFVWCCFSVRSAYINHCILPGSRSVLWRVQEQHQSHWQTGKEVWICSGDSTCAKEDRYFKNEGQGQHSTSSTRHNDSATDNSETVFFRGFYRSTATQATTGAPWGPGDPWDPFQQ